MRFQLEGLTVFFPYEFIYPEQYQYMLELKHALDAKGHCLLEMPTGTGKTVTLLSLVTSYQLAHPEVGKLIYCTRTVPEMEKVLAELKELVAYRGRYWEGGGGGGGGGGGASAGPAAPRLLALGLSSRKNLCVHPRIAEEGSRESVDAGCMRLTAPWVRQRAGEAAAAAAADPAAGRSVATAGGDLEDAAGGAAPQLCDFYEGLDAAGPDGRLEAGVYTLHDLRQHGRKRGWCPYFLARHMVAFANVVVFNYQYMIDPKVSAIVSREMERECVVVFDEASAAAEARHAPRRRGALQGDAAPNKICGARELESAVLPGCYRFRWRSSPPPPCRPPEALPLPTWPPPPGGHLTARPAHPCRPLAAGTQHRQRVHRGAEVSH
jgi:DNA excision repair protein ERCC-2